MTAEMDGTIRRKRDSMQSIERIINSRRLVEEENVDRKEVALSHLILPSNRPFVACSRKYASVLAECNRGRPPLTSKIVKGLLVLENENIA
jgi:hypothetical protein